MAVSVVLLDLVGVVVALPERPHISIADGGHLVVVPTRHVKDRRDLIEREFLQMFYGSKLAAGALSVAFGVDWFNFQENGNWSLGTDGQPHLHLHVYGRARAALEQPFGEALRFPERRQLADWRVPAVEPEQIARLQWSMADITSKSLRSSGESE